MSEKTEDSKPALKDVMQIGDDLTIASFDNDTPPTFPAFNDRMEDRPEPKPAEPAETRSGPRTNRRWGDTPCLADQALRHPDSVRLGRRVTSVLNLSDAVDLAKFNELQQASYAENAKKVIIEVEKEFHAGTWYCCVTYAEMEYEQLN